MIAGLSDIGLLILRVFVGLVFAAHGVQKLFGWFGGPGLAGFTGWLQSLGLRPARLWAWIAALVETVGGLLLALGVLTPIVGALLISQMLMAIAKAHWRNGFFNSSGGYEFNLTLMATLLALVFAGPGAYALGPQTIAQYSEAVLFVGALVVGILVVLIGLVTSLRPAEQQPEAAA